MIATQTAIGEVGSKATTELSWDFETMVNTGKFQYGLNSSGIYLVNSGEQDDGVDYTRSFTLASTDFGMENLKRLRFLYVGVNAESPFKLEISGDDNVWMDQPLTLLKSGLQTITVPATRAAFGSYWSLRISSTNRFRIDRIGCLLVVLHMGHRG